MALQRLYSLDDVFPGRLDELLRDEKYVEELHALQDPELSQVVDHLDEVGLPSGTRGPADRSFSQTVARLNRTGGSSRKCLQILRRICAKRKVLPSTFELSKELLPPDKPPKAQGGFCDAYEGTISIKVCIKRLRISTMESQQEKMKEVHRSCEFPLNCHPHNLRSYSTRKLLCGNIWFIRISCLSRV